MTAPEPAPKVVDHVWRSDPHAGQACAYMNCGRPRSEHEHAVLGRGGTKVIGPRLPERS